jgi:hypothetical protein
MLIQYGGSASGGGIPPALATRLPEAGIKNAASRARSRSRPGLNMAIPLEILREVFRGRLDA